MSEFTDDDLRDVLAACGYADTEANMERLIDDVDWEAVEHMSTNDMLDEIGEQVRRAHGYEPAHVRPVEEIDEDLRVHDDVVIRAVLVIEKDRLRRWRGA